MANLNHCTFIGRLGRDPEIRYTPSGSAVASIALAVSDQWKDKNSGEKQERTEWVNVSAFNRLAEIMGEYLKKGSLVYISGKMQTDKYQDKETGKDRYSTKIIASQMQMLDSRGDSSSAPQQRPQQQPAQQAPQQSGGGGFDDIDGIPFRQLGREHSF